MCGHPIFAYHHIVPYTDEDPHYRPKDMMVLCPNDHDRATQGVLGEAEQRQFKARPYNIERGMAGGQLTVEQENPSITIGESVEMIGAGSLLEVDGESLLSISLSPENTLLLSATLYDQEDRLVARLVENAWESEDPLPWDLDFSYRRLTIRSAPRKITLAINATKDPVDIRGELWRRGVPIGLRPDGIRWAGGGGIQDLILDTATVRLTSKGDIAVGRQRPAPIRTREDRIGRNELCWCGSSIKYKLCHGR